MRRKYGDQMIYDEHRTLELEALGYKLLRFWNNDVVKNTDGVLEVILEALASPAPHPSPLSEGERE